MNRPHHHYRTRNPISSAEFTALCGSVIDRNSFYATDRIAAQQSQHHAVTLMDDGFDELTELEEIGINIMLKRHTDA